MNNSLQDSTFELRELARLGGKRATGPDVCVVGEAVWVAWTERQPDGDVVKGSILSTEGRSSVATLSTAPGVAFQPRIVGTRNGELVATWVERHQQRWTLMAVAGRAGTFDAPQPLLESRDGVFHPAITADAAGNPWVACQVIDGGRSSIHVLTLASGVWSKVAESRADLDAFRSSLSRGPEDGVWLAYDAFRDGHYSVRLMRVDRNDTDIAVADNGYQNLQPDISADPEGNLWIAWASNQDAAARHAWWLPKWVNLRRFDGRTFSQPLGEPSGRDMHREDSFQGFEFPSVHCDDDGRVWVFGQGAHVLYAQFYRDQQWSPLFDISQRKWGTWKPRIRVAGTGPLFVAAVDLDGALVQVLKPKETTEEDASRCTHPRVGPVHQESPPLHVGETRSPRHSIEAKSGERLSVFFGDLHAHSVYGDATGDVDELYNRYRYGYGYDFACLTEHDYLDGMELSRSELQMAWSVASRTSQEGEFIAFHGYEWTSPAISEHAQSGQPVGEGHKHIIFPNDEGTFVSYADPTANTGAKMQARLNGRDVLVVPHHTGWSGTDWDAHDPDLQRLVEVCSIHGRFEYANNHPIGHRRDHVFQHEFVHDALARGYRLGFVGGSDSHGLRWHGTELTDRAGHVKAGARVGWKEDAYRGGMTAILAPSLSRADLYSALKARRCYATSGVPIFLDFRVNDELMGSEVILNGPPTIACSVHGTGDLRSVEVIRSSQVIGAWRADAGTPGEMLSLAFADHAITPDEEHYYYVRVVQEDGNMAWSTPIWVKS